MLLKQIVKFFFKLAKRKQLMMKNQKLSVKSVKIQVNYQDNDNAENLFQEDDCTDFSAPVSQISKSKTKDVEKENSSFYNLGQMKKYSQRLSPLSEVNREKIAKNSKSAERKYKDNKEKNGLDGKEMQKQRNSMIEQIYRSSSKSPFERDHKYASHLRQESQKSAQLSSRSKDTSKKDQTHQNSISKDKQEISSNISKSQLKIEKNKEENHNESLHKLQQQDSQQQLQLKQTQVAQNESLKQLQVEQNNSQIKTQQEQEEEPQTIKNLQMQKQQLQRMEQFMARKEDGLQDLLIKEEEEDEEDGKGSCTNKQVQQILQKEQQKEAVAVEQTKQEVLIIGDMLNIKDKSKDHLFLENEHDLSVIKEMPAGSEIPNSNTEKLNSQQLKKQEMSKFSRKVVFSSNSITRGERDIASILHELDSQDECIRTAPIMTRTATNSNGHFENQTHVTNNLFPPPQMAAFKNHTQKKSNNSLKKQIGTVYMNFKNFKTYEPSNKGSNSLVPPPLLQTQSTASQMSSTQNFFNQNGGSKSKKLSEGNFQLNNHNYLQDIRDLKKRLNQQSFGMKAFNF